MIISTDKQKLNIPLIHDYLSNQSYWGQGRSLKEVSDSVNNSLCFGAYHKNNQIGFARVVSDNVIFAYIMDVFVLEEFRGKGIGKKIMNEIINHSDLKDVKRIVLATRDAHGLYSQFGFAQLLQPQNFMERFNVLKSIS